MLRGNVLKKYIVTVIQTLVMACFMALSFSAAAQVIFDSPGSYSYTVPAGVTEIDVEAVGASGGGGSGGSASSSAFVIFSMAIRETTATGGDGALGERTLQTLTVTPGEVLTIVVGEGGAGGLKSNDRFPPEATFGGTGGTGDPAGVSGGNAAGGYDNLGLLSGGGGGAGGGSSVSSASETVRAQGGAGGGGGSAAYAMDTESGRLIFNGTPGQAASTGGQGGLCDGYANPLFMIASIAPDELNQACDIHPDGSAYQPSEREHGGNGAPGYTGRGDVSRSGGTGAPTVSGGEPLSIDGMSITIYENNTDGEAGANGSDGYVQLTSKVSLLPPPVSTAATAIPTLPVPVLMITLLLICGLGLRRWV